MATLEYRPRLHTVHTVEVSAAATFEYAPGAQLVQAAVKGPAAKRGRLGWAGWPRAASQFEPMVVLFVKVMAGPLRLRLLFTAAASVLERAGAAHTLPEHVVALCAAIRDEVQRMMREVLLRSLCLFSLSRSVACLGTGFCAPRHGSPSPEPVFVFVRVCSCICVHVYVCMHGARVRSRRQGGSVLLLPHLDVRRLATGRYMSRGAFGVVHVGELPVQAWKPQVSSCGCCVPVRVCACACVSL